MRLQPSSVLNLDESEDHVEVAKLVESRRDELEAMLQVRVYHALFRIHGFELTSSLNRLKIRLVITYWFYDICLNLTLRLEIVLIDKLL